MLVGPNNAGKSSLIDLIRLLAGGSSSSRDDLFELDFNVDDHRLSSIDRVFSDGEKELEVGIRFDAPNISEPFQIHLDGDVSVRRRYQRRGDSAQLSEMDGFLLPSDDSTFPTEGDYPNDKRIFRSEYELEEVTGHVYTGNNTSEKDPVFHPEHWEIGYNWDDDEPKIDYVEEHIEYIESESETSSTDEETTGERVSYTTTELSFSGVLDPPLIKCVLALLNALRSEAGKPRIDVEAGSAHASEAPDPLSSLLVTRSFNQDFISRLDLPEGWPPDFEDEVWEPMKKFLSPLAESLDEASRPSVTYIPSHRASGREYYGPSSSLTDLLKSFAEGSIAIHNTVNKWIKEFDLGEDFQVEQKGPSLYEATIEKDGERRPLADFGSGVSQLVPLILQLATSLWGVLLTEEPEANLHPDLQARLADLFSDFAELQQSVVETHSEYFVRRLQYLVARGEIEPDMVQILYIEPPGEGTSSQVRPISIDEKGQLSEPFGPGFYDQATDLMVDLFKYGSEN